MAEARPPRRHWRIFRRNFLFLRPSFSLVAALVRPHLQDRHQGADVTKFIWYTRLVTTIKVSISPVLGQRALACRPSRALSHKVDVVLVLVPYDITTRYYPALRRQGYLNLQSHRCAGSVLLGEGLGLSVLLDVGHDAKQEHQIVPMETFRDVK